MTIRHGERHDGDGLTYRAIRHIQGRKAANYPGILSLDACSDAGALTQYYIWIDSNGLIRASSTLPTDQDANGSILTVVGQKEVLTVPVSFEADGVGVQTVYFPYAVTINRVRSCVTKVLGATNTGTITAKNAAGTGMTGGVVTLAISAAVGELDDSGAISANNTIAADSFMTLTTAKTTAGGTAAAYVEYTRTA